MTVLAHPRFAVKRRQFREADVFRDWRGRFAEKPDGLDLGGIGPIRASRPDSRRSRGRGRNAGLRERVLDRDRVRLMTEDELLDALSPDENGEYPDEDVLQAIDRELQRREQARQEMERALASRDDKDALTRPFDDLYEDYDTAVQRRIDELVAAGRDYRSAYAEAHGLDEDELTRQDMVAIIDAQRLPGETREQALRRMYHEVTMLNYLQAEQWTNGHMLNQAAREENARRRRAGTRTPQLSEQELKALSDEEKRREEWDAAFARGQSEEDERRAKIEAEIANARRGEKGKMREAERIRRREWTAARREEARAEKARRRDWDAAHRRRSKVREVKLIEPFDLFSGPRTIARKYASEELKRFWAEVTPRQTYTEFRAAMLGRASDRAAAERIRLGGSGRDFGL